MMLQHELAEAGSLIDQVALVLELLVRTSAILGRLRTGTPLFDRSLDSV